MGNQLKVWAQSSTDPAVVANTIKGLVLASATIITFLVAQLFHVTLTADNINMLATDVGLASGAIWTVYGLVMKLVMWFAKEKPAV